MINAILFHFYETLVNMIFSVYVSDVATQWFLKLRHFIVPSYLSSCLSLRAACAAP